MKARLILTVAAIMAGLFALDQFLAGLERSEMANEARTHYVQGDQALARSDAKEAVTLFRQAHMLARGNRTYELALARALIASGRLPDAKAQLEDLLDTEPNDGETNLWMARLDAKTGNRTDAEAYYHRALYGTWPAGHDSSNVRMELIRFLAEMGDQRRLLSELLVFEDESPPDRALTNEIAGLFLKAGSPGRATQVYRELIHRDPDDLAAYLGLGEAELHQGDFRAAQSSFLQALRKHPGDPDLIRRVQFTSTLSGLDPTPRRLPSHEKLDRSNRILELAQTDLAQCPGHEQSQSLIDAANQLRSEDVKGRITNEMAEDRLALAEQLWEARNQICKQPVGKDDPLPLIMAKVTRRD